MDAIDILGGILRGGKPSGGGGGAGSGGMGGSILRDILGGGGSRRTAQPRQQGSRPPTESEIERQAEELEDLLNVANERDSGGAARRGGAAATTTRGAPSRPIDWGNAGSSTANVPPPITRARKDSISLEDDADPLNEEALVLIRAMINAAKSDGRVTRDEQKAILGRLEGAPREAVDFLQREFDRSVDVREFAWSVPVGMEQKVYGVSIAVIDLDANSEARYLHDLAHGLRIPPSTRDAIHRRLGAPVIKA